MDPKRKNAWTLMIAGIVTAIVFFILNGLFAHLHPRLPGMLTLGINAGNAIACWGCIRLAVLKGYAWYVGLIGIFSLLGVIVVGFVLKDKAAAESGAS